MSDEPAATAFLARLETIVRERMETGAQGSYVAELLRSGPRRRAQKLGEEALELALAAAAGDVRESLEEAADLLFHLLVLLNAGGIRLGDVVAVLERRHRAAVTPPE